MMANNNFGMKCCAEMSLNYDYFGNTQCGKAWLKQSPTLQNDGVAKPAQCLKSDHPPICL